METNRYRATAPKSPIEFDADGKPLCNYCNKPMDSLRYRFCSVSCCHEHKVRSSGAYARAFVIERDKKCVICGASDYERKNAIFEITGGYHSIPTQVEVHHRVSVSQGGGACGLENLELRCLSCHSEETKLQRIKRDADRRKRREEQILCYLEREDFGASTEEIINAVGISKSSVCEYLKVLKERDWIFQSKRGAYISLTSKGLNALNNKSQVSFYISFSDF